VKLLALLVVINLVVPTSILLVTGEKMFPFRPSSIWVGYPISLFTSSLLRSVTYNNVYKYLTLASNTLA